MRLLFFCLVLILGSSHSWGRVRKIEVARDQVATVKTATNVATIIQVPDKPTSLVVGDQNSFKVEYLDRAVTIKPLHARARSNLFIYTESRRFNVQLVTETEASADYVVYLENPQRRVTREMRQSLTGRLTNEPFTLEMQKGVRAGSLITLEFKVTSGSRTSFDPAWIWVTQNGWTVPVHLLALERADLVPGRGTNGVLQIRFEDLDPSLAVRLELRRKRTSFLTIPKVASWE